MLEAEKFSCKIIEEGDKTVVILAGTLDEDALLDKIEFINVPTIFNLKGILKINSLGIRNWVSLLKNLKQDIYFVECSPTVVRQLSRVPSFSGNAKVLSVYVRYQCDSCDQHSLVLIKHEQFKKKPPDVPEVIECSHCQKKRMVTSDHLEQYFAFCR